MDLPIIDVQGVWFYDLVAGRKKVEGRKATEKWLKLRDRFLAGSDEIILVNSSNDADPNFRKAKFKIVDVREYTPLLNQMFSENLIEYVFKYSSVRKYLEQEGLRNTLPGIPDIESGVDVYRKWSTDQELADNNFLAFELKFVSWL